MISIVTRLAVYTLLVSAVANGISILEQGWYILAYISVGALIRGVTCTVLAQQSTPYRPLLKSARDSAEA